MKREVVNEIIDKVKTPNKIDRLVLKPSYIKGDFDSHAVDCPFLFFNEGNYYMTYVGWDGIGYRTGIAISNNLVDWKKKGMILDRGPVGSIIENNVALTSILRDNYLSGKGKLKRKNGKYIGTYHTYPEKGYETGPGTIGLCYSENLFEWEVKDPVLMPESDNKWESGGLYKSWLMEYNGTYYIFYNAKNSQKGHWREQIGLATSKNLVNWEKYERNPVLKTGKEGTFDDRFVADPCVLKYKDYWLMFYYGNSSDGHARDSVAFSHDLYNWHKSNEILVDTGPQNSIDELFAHKPAIITEDNLVYHFYCAASQFNKNKLPANKDNIVDTDKFFDIRGISFASN